MVADKNDSTAESSAQGHLDPESAAAWEAAWLEEISRREELEPEEALSAEQELSAVKRRLRALVW